MRRPFVLGAIIAVLCGAVGILLLLMPRQTVVVRPGEDLQRAVDKVAEGGTVVLEDGIFVVARPLRITTPGITLTAANLRAARLIASRKFAKHHKTNKAQLIRVDSPQVTIKGLALDGQFVTLLKGIDASDTDEQESASHGLVVDNCEVLHFAHHAIDIDGDDAIVRKCFIHDNLWNENGMRHDVHGVVTTNAQRLTVEQCTIHNCSGDCVQGEHGSWDMLQILNCDLSNAPLPRDLGGFKRGTYPGENAFDSKHVSGSRGRVALVNCKMHGFRTSLRAYTSAIVLKENVDAVIDSCDIYDSTIALRLRGFSHGMAMWPVVMNCVIRGNDVAFRLEDRLQKFRLLHCTIYDNRQQTIWAGGGRPWRGNWDNSEWALINNLWVEPASVPEIATRQDFGAAGNLVIARSDVDSRLVPLDPLQGVQVPPIVDQWYEPTGRVVRDKRGVKRKTPGHVGAFE